jgi:hypothetical protein
MDRRQVCSVPLEQPANTVPRPCEDLCRQTYLCSLFGREGRDIPHRRTERTLIVRCRIRSTHHHADDNDGQCQGKRPCCPKDPSLGGGGRSGHRITLAPIRRRNDTVNIGILDRSNANPTMGACAAYLGNSATSFAKSIAAKVDSMRPGSAVT